MNITDEEIHSAAQDILLRVESGELEDGCCMAAASTPVREAWEAAEALVEKGALTGSQKANILLSLDDHTRRTLKLSNADDFDLIYEKLLQLIGQS